MLKYYDPIPTIFRFAGGETLIDVETVSTPFGVEVDPTEAKIEEFSYLPGGWHYGEGVAPTRKMVNQAVGWSKIIKSFGFPKTDAFPGVDGEIMVTGYLGQHYVELLIEEGSVTLTYESAGKEVACFENVTPSKAFEELQRIAGGIWNTSGYSIQNILTVNSPSSRAWRSKTPGVGLPSFNTPAWTQPEPQSANTFAVTILTSAENRQFSGSLTIRSSRRRRK